MNNFLMEITDVSKSYPIVGGKLRQVLSNVSFSIRTGEIIGLMGPSGSGKSTLARIILGLERPDSGSIQVLGKDISHLSRSQKKEHFRQVQMVWQ
ncbi:MAG: ATP-binding cassette domain-containing protein, partial [Desulfobacteraceae bacterium]